MLLDLMVTVSQLSGQKPLDGHLRHKQLAGTALDGHLRHLQLAETPQ